MRDQFYPRGPRSVGSARGFAREALRGWGAGARAEDVVLCVSELATNAVRHGAPQGRGFLVRLMYFGGTVRVEVHDSGWRRPGPARPSGEAGLAEGGRGLLIVAGISDGWGVLERRPGKVVWAEFGRQDPKETASG